MTESDSVKRRIHLVAGARPNFMKIGPLYHALAATSWADPILVHTGQHFSPEMSDVFLRDLGLPEPHVHLHASGDSHATQTAAVLTAYEQCCLRDRPDAVVVAGDVNSTLAACLAARKLNLFVAHLEAGLRSRDRTMPEEINRIAVDTMADLLWTPSEDADANLLSEGVPASRIDRVGNIMIDAYCMMERTIDRADTAASAGVGGTPFIVATIHRPVNVDDRAALETIVNQLVELRRHVAVVFPIHPRTRARLEQHGLDAVLTSAGIVVLPPLAYVGFMSLVKASAGVVTDSGGVQEETSYLGIPCLTVRESTERPITVTLGTNRLVSRDAIVEGVRSALREPPPRRAIPLWDGHAAGRVALSLRKHLDGLSA